MKIWVDADACPVVIKEILFRAAMRCEVHTTLVANQPTSVPSSPFISSLQVSAGFDRTCGRIVFFVVNGRVEIQHVRVFK